MEILIGILILAFIVLGIWVNNLDTKMNRKFDAMERRIRNENNKT